MLITTLLSLASLILVLIGFGAIAVGLMNAWGSAIFGQFDWITFFVFFITGMVFIAAAYWVVPVTFSWAWN